MNNGMKNPLTNVMKIMTMVLRKMENKGTIHAIGSPMVARLLKKGFSLEDIDSAMKWLAMMTASQEPQAATDATQDGEGKPLGVRHLHASEAIRLTLDAQQMLLNLLDGGQISPLHFEKTIEFLWKNDLRDVNPTRLELILYMNDPNPVKSHQPVLSEKVGKPLYIN